MRRELILLALLVLCACVRFHGEKRNHRNKFKRFLNRIKNFTPEQFQKFQTEFLSDKKPQKETHRQAEIARKVNKLKTTWTATEYKRDYKPLLGAILDGKKRLPRKTFEKKRNDLPDSYDPRDEFPNCESLKEIRDQANCGSCWAFGAVEAMSDRICIKSGQTDQRRVSAQNLVTCCPFCGFGCQGGYPAFAWEYWVDTGIVTGGGYQDKTYCQPYFLPECDHHTEGPHGPCPDIADTPDCVTNCDDGNQQPYDSEMTKGTTAYSVYGEDDIMQEIYDNGPVEAAFSVYEDFLTYKTGIYQHVTGDYLGGHAIKLLGWGVEDGTKYWIAVNSWNEDWGDNGTFKILKGTDECGIEGSACAGIPDL